MGRRKPSGSSVPFATSPILRNNQEIGPEHASQGQDSNCAPSLIVLSSFQQLYQHLHDISPHCVVAHCVHGQDSPQHTLYTIETVARSHVSEEGSNHRE